MASIIRVIIRLKRRKKYNKGWISEKENGWGTYGPFMEEFLRHVAECPVCMQEFITAKDRMALGLMTMTSDEGELAKLVSQRMNEPQ